MPGVELAFDPARCGCAAIPRIPPGGLVTNGYIPPAPDPIQDCSPDLSPLAPDTPPGVLFANPSGTVEDGSGSGPVDFTGTIYPANLAVRNPSLNHVTIGSVWLRDVNGASLSSTTFYMSQDTGQCLTIGGVRMPLWETVQVGSGTGGGGDPVGAVEFEAALLTAPADGGVTGDCPHDEFAHCRQGYGWNEVNSDGCGGWILQAKMDIPINGGALIPHDDGIDPDDPVAMNGYRPFNYGTTKTVTAYEQNTRLAPLTLPTSRAPGGATVVKMKKLSVDPAMVIAAATAGCPIKQPVYFFDYPWGTKRPSCADDDNTGTCPTGTPADCLFTCDGIADGCWAATVGDLRMPITVTLADGTILAG